MTIYILGLASWCAAPRHPHRPTYHRSSGIDRLQHIMNMPSLPIRGHVPDLIKNPLGSNLTGSWTYKAWLRLGALLGVLLPFVALAQVTLRGYYGFSTEWMIITGDINKAKRILGVPYSCYAVRHYLRQWQERHCYHCQYIFLFQCRTMHCDYHLFDYGLFFNGS